MTLLDDLRYAARTLWKSPGFATVAIATLALGIGANSAIWSVLSGVLLRPLPYRDSERLVRIYYADPEQAGGISAAFSPQDFADLATDLGMPSRPSPFARIAASHFVPGLTGMNLSGGGEPERVDSATVTGGYFSTLGVPAALGRTIEPVDDVVGKDRVVVLSDALWKRRFGGDPRVVGRQVTLEGEPFTVVGVMPPSFALPAREVDLWAPISVDGRDGRVTPEAGTFIVTPGYFRALGIPLLSGRDFTARDGVEAPPAVIVNRALARRLWPEGDAVGRHVRFGEKPVEVIAVVGDVRHEALAKPPAPALYLPNSRSGFAWRSAPAAAGCSGWSCGRRPC